MEAQVNESNRTAQGMYDPRFEHDNCGIGAVVNIKGVKSHATVENALKIVENLKHRAGKDAEGKTGDGVGILLFHISSLPGSKSRLVSSCRFHISSLPRQ